MRHGEDFGAIGGEGGGDRDGDGGGCGGVGGGLGDPFGQTATEPEGGGDTEEEAEQGGGPDEAGEVGQEGIEQKAFAKAEAGEGFKKEGGVAGAALEVGLALDGGDGAIKPRESEAGSGALEGVSEQEGGQGLGRYRKPDGDGEQQQANAARNAQVEAAQDEVDGKSGDCAGREDKAEFRQGELGALLDEAIEHSHAAKMAEEKHAQSCGEKRQAEVPV